ncbi:uncharacterized protein STEHIDRAFT_78748 [Stereum hirsutum FP-91666 SS1]|uniref:uncharacterized protein n=1 Tax=Stereum hirsutum (strain FP-91666) TaxID=721885 RepID=UPI000440D64B|nr:uncharacterized protein STEHIDRAFT_78748 [Stereum hirsutum FP-91666 SS1]EIM87666.1 hypothetical protein STEHIDRAFT_78748 [Stereum hirsutum FP-91666 SS1]
MQSARVCARTLCASSSRARISSSLHRPTRFIHATPTVHRSKAKKAAIEADADDLFAFEDSEELIPLGSTAEETASTSSNARTKSSQTTDYAAKFAEHLKFLSEHNGKRPAVRDGKQVADSIWLHLLGNARSQEDLEKVAKQFMPWKDAGREIKPRVVDLFVLKCKQLGCTKFALDVFSNHATYGLDLDRTSGRHLLHGLHLQHDLSDSITLAALYDVFNLRGLSSDPVSCAMLTAACLREASRTEKRKDVRDDARLVGQALLPSLQRALTKYKTAEKLKGKRYSEKEISWLRWTLKKVEIGVVKAGWSSAWLREFREANKWGDEGHATLRAQSGAPASA